MKALWESSRLWAQDGNHCPSPGDHTLALKTRSSWKREESFVYLEGDNAAGSLDFKSALLLGICLAVKHRTGEVDAVQGVSILRGARIIQVALPLVVEEPAAFPALDGSFAAKLT